MEKTNLHYSAKNIPIADEKSYKMKLLEKIEAVIKRMRWKALFLEKENGNKQEEVPIETYGLKTNNTPPQVQELIAFEKELIELTKKIKFRRGTNEFQSKLKQDIRSIKQSEKVYTPADKTSNMYKMSKERYEQLLMNSITTTYKKADKNISKKINKEGKELIKDNPVINRMTINAENNSFITLKDHKENFQNHPKTRLINPAKNELGRISKTILEKLNKSIRESLDLKQWKSTTDVIDWFDSIQEKTKYKFMMFDIKDFYPSINEKLLKDAIEFANTIHVLTEKEVQIIDHARKSLLFNKGETWVKKGKKLFDVTMGAFDGAEVCELVGCFLLNKLSSKYNKNEIGLYRDDGLAVFKNVSGTQIERIKKDFQKIFKNHGLDITIECNMTQVNYLDVTLDLVDSSYRPYHKPDNETNYIHKNSNHPPNIIKQIPISIETRISKLSSNENIFKEAVPYYEAALQRSGYEHTFTYNQTRNNVRHNNKNRKRKIIWFNPPYNSNVSTNIGKFFLNLIKKHFPKNHKFHKLFNKNNIKVSYSCMPSIKSIINSHNKKILHTEPANNNQKTCNCQNKDNCPLNNQCLTKSIIYEATLTSNIPNYPEKKYIGLCETTFKKRFANHKQSFNTKKYKNNTALSTEYWKIKEQQGIPKVKWKIIRKAKASTPESRNCQLCLGEKYEIACYDGQNLLNKRNEVVAKCRHKHKYILASYDNDVR